MLMKYDHMVTTILKFNNTDMMTIAELQGSIESHVSKILEKIEKPIAEALKSQVKICGTWILVVVITCVAKRNYFPH